MFVRLTRYEWIQNAEKIFLTFFVRGLDASHVKVEFKARALLLRIVDPAADPESDDATKGSHVFTFNIPFLRHEIDPLRSKHELYPVSLQILHASAELDYGLFRRLSCGTSSHLGAQ